MWRAFAVIMALSPAVAWAANDEVCLKATGLAEKIDLSRLAELRVGTWPAVQGCQALALHRIGGGTVDLTYAWGPYLTYKVGLERHNDVPIASDGSIAFKTRWGSTITYRVSGEVIYSAPTLPGPLTGRVSTWSKQ